MDFWYVFVGLLPLIIFIWYYYKENYEPKISDDVLNRAEKTMHRYGRYKIEEITKFARCAKGSYSDRMVWIHHNVNQNVPFLYEFEESLVNSFSEMTLFDRDSKDKAMIELKKWLKLWTSDKIQRYYDLNVEFNMSGVVHCGVYLFDYNALAYYHALLIADENPHLQLSSYLFDSLWHNGIVIQEKDVEKTKPMSSFLHALLTKPACFVNKDVLKDCYFLRREDPTKPFVSRFD